VNFILFEVLCDDVQYEDITTIACIRKNINVDDNIQFNYLYSSLQLRFVYYLVCLLDRAYIVCLLLMFEF
jgi:hypothetical protein